MTNSSDRTYWTDERLDRLAKSTEETASATRDLRLAVEAQTTVMNEVIDQLVTLRDENKRILDYLFGQQRRNGYGDQP
jgi:hypothetical protein